MKVQTISLKRREVTLVLHINGRIIKHKLGLLNLAEELGNVSKACQVMGLSRDQLTRRNPLVYDLTAR